MSMNILNDISKVYMEKVSPKPDFLDLDKDGNKIFKAEDKLALMYKVDSDIVAKIANAMVQNITPEEVKKN